MGTRLDPLLLERQEETIESVNELLDTYGKCLMVRPTGFGKTYLLVEKFTKPFIKNNKDKKVVYIYPLDIIKTEITAGKKKKDEDGNIIITKSKYLKDNILKFEGKNQNIEFISYQKLSSKFGKDNDYWRNYFNDNNVGLIILDEAHKAGSETFYSIFDTLRDSIGPDKIRILGATATPDRMDDCDDKPSVLEAVFDNKQPFKYDLGNALKDGLIPEIIYMADIYTINKQAKKTRGEAKKKFGKDFDEKSFNVELGRLRQETGDEPNVIMKAVCQAGYNPVKDKYYKFIVFFNDINDIVENAVEVEKWFEEGFNTRIKDKFQLKRNFTIRTSYVTSSDPNGGLHDLVEKSPNRKYFNKTEKVEEIMEEDYCVDLLFTVDMINMGYHVENITGILMKRGTQSEIVYYQQLGRALSVSASHSPIVIDSVNNIGEKFWFKKDAKRRIENGNNTPTERKERTLPDLDLRYLGSTNSYTKFFERFNNDDNMVERLDIEFMYNNRHMPLYLLASYYNINCKELVKKLVKYNIKIRTEDEEYQRLMDNCSDYIKAGNKTKLAQDVSKFRFINCKKATYDGECPYIKNKQTPTMYDMLNNK